MKFGLWIDFHLGTEHSTSSSNTLHGSRQAAEKSEILLQIEKAAKISDVDLTSYVISLEDSVNNVAIKDPMKF